MVEKEIRRGICHKIHQYAKANKSMRKIMIKIKNQVGLRFSEFDEGFINSYNEESDEGYFLEVDVQYPKKFHEHQNDLQFLAEGMKIEKVEKFVVNLYDKSEYVIHIRNIKRALNHGLVFKKVRRIIKFNQKAWLKSYIDMNANLRKRK